LRSNVSDAQINGGWVIFGPNLGVFPLEQTRHVGVAKSEHPISKNSDLYDHNPLTSQTDGQTDGQRDRQTTCDRNTALCTKVHRAVKTTTTTTTKSNVFDYLEQTIVIRHLEFKNLNSGQTVTI